MGKHVTIQMPAVRRAAEVRADSFNEQANTVEIIWSTGARVRRNSWWDGPYDEELDMSPKAVRLERLNSGAPLLNSHDAFDLSSVLGSVVPGSARISGGKGHATVKLSNAADVADAVLKIRDGDVRFISVGYRIHRVEKTEGQEGDVPLHRVVDWEPLEVSAVAIPADPGSQVRSESQQTYPVIIETKGGRPMPANPNPNPAPADAELERARAATIADLGRRFGVSDLAADAIRDGTDLADFRRSVIDKLAEDDRRSGGYNVQTGVHAAPRDDSRENARALAIENALLHRADPGSFKLDDRAGGRDFVGLPLLEIARHCLEVRGVRTPGMSKMAVAGEALAQRSGGLHSTSDFPAILSNVAGKTLRAGYSAAPQTFRPIVRVTTVPDFKEVSRTQISEAPSLERVNEHGEFTRGRMGDAAEKYAIQTFGRIVGVTRQVIVNDDLNAFTRIPRAFGQQAAQLESDLVWAQLLANPKMSDNVDLFHSDHGNLGTDLAIGAAAVSEARLKLGLQKGLDGSTVLNLSPVYMITSKASQTAAETYLAQIYPAKVDDAIPASLKALTLISEPRLDNGIPRYGIAGDANAFYFAADINQVDLIELAYLEGQEGVFTETRVGFDVDGVEIKCRMDVGAKAIDWRGFVKTPYDGPGGG